MSDGKKYFVLMENGKDTSQVFASKQPRGAALKAATRGHETIRLRARHQACPRLHGQHLDGPKACWRT